MATYIPNLASGIAPQNVSLIRVRIDPPTVFGVTGANAQALLDNDAHVNCPIGVPLFTTEAAIGSARTTAKYGDEELMPVVFNLDSYAGGNGDLIFVGISYAEASRKQPVVAAAVSGLMTIPRPSAGPAGNLVGTRVAWLRSALRYGSTSGPRIAVVGAGGVNFSPKDVNAFVMSAGPYRFTILLG
jgi:hypothetical protein